MTAIEIEYDGGRYRVDANRFGQGTLRIVLPLRPNPKLLAADLADDNGTPVLCSRPEEIPHSSIGAGAAELARLHGALVAVRVDA